MGKHNRSDTHARARKKRFETYFPHVDNVYSHRSTQRYKRKPFVSHYWDCRMKGRPPGTAKSTDPGKQKRKRVTRGRDLCDVKIKITEHHLPGAGAGGGDGDGDGGPRRRWTIQRVNGNGGNGKGDGVSGPHKHTLARSDEIKRNSVQRYVAGRERQVRRAQVSADPWEPLNLAERGEEVFADSRSWKCLPTPATGVALATAKGHSREHELKLFATCFW